MQNARNPGLARGVYLNYSHQDHDTVLLTERLASVELVIDSLRNSVFHSYLRVT